jgi:hypothetical protein
MTVDPWAVLSGGDAGVSNPANWWNSGTVSDNPNLVDINGSATILWAPNTTPTTVGQAGLDFQYMDVNDTSSWNMYKQLLADRGYPTDAASVIAQANRAIVWAAEGYDKGKSVFDFFLALPPAGNPSGGPKKTTNIIQNISNTGDAKATLNTAYQQTLGRMASDKEVEAFQKALNALEAKNPSVTSGVTNSDGSSASYSGKSTGGFNAATFASDWAMSRPDYAETFAATSFMNVVENLINSGPSVQGKVTNG